MSKVLVAYFSASGTTAKAAKNLAEALEKRFKILRQAAPERRSRRVNC